MQPLQKTVYNAVLLFSYIKYHREKSLQIVWPLCRLIINVANLVIEHELMWKLKIYMCLGGIDIFHRSVNMFLYFVFTKLGALNAYNDFGL